MKEFENYQCKNCNQSFTKQFDFLEHENIHYGVTPFMCSVCSDSFSTIKDYVSHVKEHHVYRCKNCEDIFYHEGPFFQHSCKSNSNIECEKPASIEIHEEPKQQPTSYSCKICSKKYSDLVEFKKHKKIHLKNKLKCPFCTRFFFNSKIFKKHVKSHSDEFTCECKLSFDSFEKYSAHKKEFHSFKCDYCNKCYSSQEKLLNHVCFISSNGEPFKCSCFETFTKSETFREHIGNRPYSCCNCSMQFNTITNLIRHIRTHTKQKPYVCKDCGRAFSQSANLKNHLSVHLGVNAVKCNECNFTCKTQSGLFKHKKKHKEGFDREHYVDGRKTSKTPVSCPICKKQFLFKRNMGMHMNSHKKSESLCTECGKVFTSKSKLTTHNKACHGEPAICQTCGKIFASSVLLAAHERIHVKSKEFSCSVCFKMFTVKNYLVQHMKTHNDGKQYSCINCGKLFKVAASLRYHSRICSSSNVVTL